MPEYRAVIRTMSQYSLIIRARDAKHKNDVIAHMKEDRKNIPPEALNTSHEYIINISTWDKKIDPGSIRPGQHVLDADTYLPAPPPSQIAQRRLHTARTALFTS